MVQALASFLFFAVFVELFLVLTIYLVVSIYGFVKKGRERPGSEQERPKDSL